VIIGAFDVTKQALLHICFIKSDLANINARSMKLPGWCHVGFRHAALPLKADMCVALAHVCFGLKADIPIKHRIVVFAPGVASNNRFLLIDADCSNYL